jgi:hypothetical protein
MYAVRRGKVSSATTLDEPVAGAWSTVAPDRLAEGVGDSWARIQGVKPTAGTLA